MSLEFGITSPEEVVSTREYPNARSVPPKTLADKASTLIDENYKFPKEYSSEPVTADFQKSCYKELGINVDTLKNSNTNLCLKACIDELGENIEFVTLLLRILSGDGGDVSMKDLIIYFIKNIHNILLDIIRDVGVGIGALLMHKSPYTAVRLLLSMGKGSVVKVFRKKISEAFPKGKLADIIEGAGNKVYSNNQVLDIAGKGITASATTVARDQTIASLKNSAKDGAKDGAINGAHVGANIYVNNGADRKKGNEK